MPQLDWSVIRRATIAGLTVLIPLTVLSLLVIDDDSSTYAQLAFFGLTRFGFAAAGYGAGKMAPHAPKAMIAAGCGIFGAVFADWVRRSGRPVSVGEMRRRLPK